MFSWNIVVVPADTGDTIQSPWTNMTENTQEENTNLADEDRRFRERV